MDLESFANRDALARFFAAVPVDLEAFDVANVPVSLWANLYLIDVQDGALVVRLAGDRLRAAFGRDLRGVDLRTVIHGPDSDRVHAAYDLAIAEGRRAAMRQTVHLRARTLTCFIECAFAPLVEDGRVRRIVGCLFAEYVSLIEDDADTAPFMTMDLV